MSEEPAVPSRTVDPSSGSALGTEELREFLGSAPSASRATQSRSGRSG
jgi:hypothetical protein